MTLAPGHKGVDYSGLRPTTDSIVKAGGRFIIRYSAGAGNTQPATAWKLCEPGEIAAAVKAGLDFFANSEWYESRITEGASAGHTDGVADLAFWKSRGLAKGASIFVSWDQAPANAEWPAAIAYLQAYDKALGGYYHVDCYAGTPFLRHALSLGVIRYGWRPNAGSWSGDGLVYQPVDAAAHVATAHAVTPAAIWQTGNYWFSKQADEDVILRVPTGSHMQALAPQPTPPPKPPKPTTPGEFTMDAAAAAKFAEIEATLARIEARFVGTDGHAHTVESTVAHVTQGTGYASKKGRFWTRLFRVTDKAAQ